MYKFNVKFVAAVMVLSFSGIATSMYVLASYNPHPSNFGTCINDCPDGRKVTCKGASLSTITDPKDPGCVCDGKAYRCSDLDKNSNTNSGNTNQNDKNKNKKKNENTSNK